MIISDSRAFPAVLQAMLNSNILFRKNLLLFIFCFAKTGVQFMDSWSGGVPLGLKQTIPGFDSRFRQCLAVTVEISVD